MSLCLGSVHIALCDLQIIDSDVELESADEDSVGDENDVAADSAVDDIVTAQSEVADGSYSGSRRHRCHC